MKKRIEEHEETGIKDFSRTEALSNFVMQSRIEDFPKEVLEAGKKCFLDCGYPGRCARPLREHFD